MSFKTYIVGSGGSLGAVPDAVARGPKTTTQAERARLPLARNGKCLYAIAFEWWDRRRKRWEADITYVLATDAGDARLQWLRSPNPVPADRINVTGVAPAIGFLTREEGDSADEGRLTA